jgi:hypothetical protein
MRVKSHIALSTATAMLVRAICLTVPYLRFFNESQPIRQSEVTAELRRQNTHDEQCDVQMNST